MPRLRPAGDACGRGAAGAEAAAPVNRSKSAMPAYRSRTTTHGRNMAGARGLWRATGMKDGDFGKPIIAVVNSFTQFVPGPRPPEGPRPAGGARDRGAPAASPRSSTPSRSMTASPWATTACSTRLPSPRADRRQRRVHGQRALRRRDGVHLQLRQDHARHADGGAAPQHPGGVRLRRPDGGRQGRCCQGNARKRSTSSTPWSPPPTTAITDEDVAVIERSACPTCGSCSGMFTANSMNCLTEALGPVAARQRLDAGHPRRPQAPVRRGRPPDRRPRPPLLRAGRRQRAAAHRRQLRGVRERHDARHRHGRLDQHGAAPAGRRPRGRGAFTMADIDRLSRRVPVLCKVAPGRWPTCTWRTCTAPAAIMAILGELDRAGLIHTDLPAPSTAGTLGAGAGPLGRRARPTSASVHDFYRAAPGGVPTQVAFSQDAPLGRARPRPRGRRDPRRRARLFARMAAWRCCTATSPRTAAS